MGSTVSSLMTQSFIQRWQPRTIVMLGIAATLSKDVHIGDIIVAKQIDAYLDNSKAVPGAYPNSYMFLPSRQVYRCSNDLLNATINFKFVHEELFQDWQQCCQIELEQLLSNELRESFIQRKLLRAQVRAIPGDIASGPTVGAAQTFKDWLKTLNRKYAALEMEAAGFMEAVNENAGGERTLVLRAISDSGDEHKQALDEVEEGVFRRYAMRNAIQLLWRFFDAGILPPYSTSTK
jgi:nucleoside phosphorylase